MVPSAPQDKKREEAEQALDLGRYAGLGFQFAGVMLAFGALGWWLDRLLGTQPWLLIVGIFVGATGAFVALLRAVPGARTRSATNGTRARSATKTSTRIPPPTPPHDDRP